MKSQQLSTYEQSLCCWRSTEHFGETNAKRKPLPQSFRVGPEACKPFVDHYECKCAQQKLTPYMIQCIHTIHDSVSCSLALWHRGTHLLI